MAVPFPVRHIDIQLDIALELLGTVSSDDRIDEVRSRFPIPKSELNNLN